MARDRDTRGDPLAAERYRLLVEQLREEIVERLGTEHGWKVEAAAVLGVSDAFIGYLEKGTKRPGPRSIELARERLRLRREFFYDESLDEPHYRNHVEGERPSGPEVELDPPHWREFIDRYEHLGEFSEAQLLDIKRFAARNLRVKSWTDWERIAEMVRTSKPSPTFEAAKKGKP